MDRSTPEAPLQQADVAIYSAKESGRQHSRLFAPGIREPVDQRLQIECGLCCAIGNDEL